MVKYDYKLPIVYRSIGEQEEAVALGVKDAVRRNGLHPLLSKSVTTTIGRNHSDFHKLMEEPTIEWAELRRRYVGETPTKRATNYRLCWI